MGGLGSGRPPDECRRREVARLRARGLLAAEIGRRLGVSRQRIGQLFRAIDRAQAGSLTCRVCGRAASPPGAAPPDAAERVVPALPGARCPDVPFAERLRSSRAAAGLRRDRAGAPHRPDGDHPERVRGRLAAAPLASPHAPRPGTGACRCRRRSRGGQPARPGSAPAPEPRRA